MPAEKIGVYSEATAREVLRRCHIQASSAPSEGLSGPDGQSTRPVPLGEPWLGIITALGPASQADYTGPQYWVETAAITNARGSNPPNTTLPTLAAQSYPNESTRWVTATNLAEVPGASHLLSAGALVIVTEMYGLDGSPYFIFDKAINGMNELSITIDGGGSAITTSSPTMGGATVKVPMACSIVGWTVESDASGSIVVDVLRANAGVPSLSIVGSGNNPTLSGEQYASAAANSSWTSKALAANDIIGFSVISATTVQRVTVTLTVK
jgi:hypothetical protein